MNTARWRSNVSVAASVLIVTFTVCWISIHTSTPVAEPASPLYDIAVHCGIPGVDRADNTLEMTLPPSVADSSTIPCLFAATDVPTSVLKRLVKLTPDDVVEYDTWMDGEIDYAIRWTLSTETGLWFELTAH